MSDEFWTDERRAIVEERERIEEARDNAHRAYDLAVYYPAILALRARCKHHGPAPHLDQYGASYSYYCGFCGAKVECDKSVPASPETRINASNRPSQTPESPRENG